MTHAAPLPRWALGLLWVAALAGAVLPLLSAPILPLLDYPAHVARLAVMLSMRRGAFFDQVYSFDSFVLPNVAYDVFGIVVGRLVGPESAARSFVFLTLLITIGGCVALGRAATGRFGLGPFVALIFLLNGVLVYGLLNYAFGVAVLLWACACWLAMTRSPPLARAGVGALFGVALFFAHLAVVGLFGVFVGACALSRMMRRGSTWRERIGAAVTAGVPFVVPALLLLASPTSGLPSPAIAFRLWPFKAQVFLTNLLVFQGDIDLPSFVLVAAGAILLTASRAAALPRMMWFPSAALLLAFIALPSRLLAGAAVDGRIPIAIWLIVIAALDIRLDRNRVRVAAVGLSAILLWRAAAVARDWYYDARYYDALRADFRRMAKPSVLFSIATFTNADGAINLSPPLFHADALAALDGDVFVPEMFAMHGQQPIVVRDAYRGGFDLMREEPLPGRTERERDAAMDAIRRDASTAQWPVYVVMFGTGDEILSAPPGTEVVASGARHLLLRLR